MHGEVVGVVVTIIPPLLVVREVVDSRMEEGLAVHSVELVSH